LWVGLFASGQVYGCKRAGCTDTFDRILDTNYEAHARYEMISRLSCQGFKHGYKPADYAERAKGFRLVRKLVRKDRLHNLQAAEQKRLASVLLQEGNDGETQALASGGLAPTTEEEDDF
jgi:hypothetical protein